MPKVSVALNDFGKAQVCGGYAPFIPREVLADPDVTFEIVPASGNPVPLSPLLQDTIREELHGKVAVGWTSNGLHVVLDLFSWTIRGEGMREAVGVRAVRRAGATSARRAKRRRGANSGVVPGHDDGEVLVQGLPNAVVWVMFESEWVPLDPELQQKVVRSHMKVFTDTALRRVQHGTQAVPAGDHPQCSSPRVVTGATEDTAAGSKAVVGPPPSGTEPDQYTADLMLMLLCHTRSKRVFPLRVTATRDPNSAVLRQAGDLGRLVLFGGWHWAPGTLCALMTTQDGSQTRPPTTLAEVEQISARLALVPRVQLDEALPAPSGRLPLRLLKRFKGVASVLDPLPIALTTQVSSNPDLVQSRMTPRMPEDFEDHYPYTFKSGTALEPEYARDLAVDFLKQGGWSDGLDDDAAIEPMARILDPRVPKDLERLSSIISYLAATLEVAHVLQVAEVSDPVRTRSVKATARIRGRQLSRMREVLSQHNRGVHAACDKRVELGLERALDNASTPAAALGNPVMLWHGTGSADPVEVMVCGGPSLDHSREGRFYGKAVYGSTSAAYSHRQRFTHKCRDEKYLLTGVHQMILFVGVAGNSYNAHSRTGLRMDDVRKQVATAATAALNPTSTPSGADKAAAVSVHSVTGYARSQPERNYAFYSDCDFAPAYLVTYRVAGAAHAAAQ